VEVEPVRMEDGGWRMDVMHYRAERIRARGDARPPKVEVGGTSGEIEEEAGYARENDRHDRQQAQDAPIHAPGHGRVGLAVAGGAGQERGGMEGEHEEQRIEDGGSRMEAKAGCERTAGGWRLEAGGHR